MNRRLIKWTMIKRFVLLLIDEGERETGEKGQGNALPGLLSEQLRRRHAREDHLHRMREIRTPQLLPPVSQGEI